MNAAKWYIEEKPDECSMVHVSNTGVDPGAMVVHLHDTSRGGKEWLHLGMKEVAT